MSAATSTTAELRSQLTRWSSTALLVLAVAAFVVRFLSSWWLLEHAGADRFDPHGFGLLDDVILLAMLAPFLAVLLVWMVRRRGTGVA